jgi:hypothetical protein
MKGKEDSALPSQTALRKLVKDEEVDRVIERTMMVTENAPRSAADGLERMNRLH